MIDGEPKWLVSNFISVPRDDAGAFHAEDEASAHQPPQAGRSVRERRAAGGGEAFLLPL
jgi:hypothetical protein